MVFESGVAGSPLTWTLVAQRIETEFHCVIHRRAEGGSHALQELSRQLRGTLDRTAVPGPYLLVAHSFGALVARQFAADYPSETTALVFVDGLPPTAEVPQSQIWAALAGVRFAEILARLGGVKQLLPLAAVYVRQFDWALQEARKVPEPARSRIIAEWFEPGFYSGLGRTLAALPANLAAARQLLVPSGVPVLSLHSDYPDPLGRRVEDAGHWIQIDQPETVAAAIRELARGIIVDKGV